MPISVSDGMARPIGEWVSTGPIAGGGQADVTVTWPVEMPDSNYIVVAQVEINDPGDSLRVRRIRSKTTTSCVVNVVNDSALTAKTGTVHAVAVRG